MRFLGVFLFIFTFINTFLLTYAFRDFSFQLTAMFLVSLIGFPLSAYMYRLKNKDDVLVDDDCEVQGKFII